MYDDCARQLDVREDTTRNNQDERCFYAFCPRTGYLQPNLTRQDLKNALSPKPKQRSSREERRLSENKVALHLKDLLFRSLGLNSAERQSVQNEITGKALADALGLRQNTIGEILNLKLKRRPKPPADIPQLFYLILKLDRAYCIFEEYAKGQRFALEKLSPEELYHRLKNRISATLEE